MPLQASPNTEVVQSLRSLSIVEGEKGQKFQNSAPNYHRARSENHGMQHLVPSNSSGVASPWSSLNLEGNSDCDSLFRRSPSVGSRFSTCSSNEIIEDTALIPLQSTEGNEIEVESPMFPQNNKEPRPSSAASGALVSTQLFIEVTFPYIIYQQAMQLCSITNLNLFIV